MSTGRVDLPSIFSPNNRANSSKSHQTTKQKTPKSIFAQLLTKKLDKPKSLKITKPQNQSPLTLLINLDRKIYHPEGLVNGVMYLRTTKKSLISTIHIKIVGKEETRISKWVKKTAIIAKVHLQKNPNVVKNDKNQISIAEVDINYYINHSFKIYDAEFHRDAETPGYYKVYFCFRLPCFLPGSFKFEWMKEKLFLNYGKIGYNVSLR